MVRKTKPMKVNEPEFYGSLCEFEDSLDGEIERLKEEKSPKATPVKRTVAKVKLLELLLLGAKKVGKMKKIYEGDLTPDIFPAEKGGDE